MQVSLRMAIAAMVLFGAAHSASLFAANDNNAQQAANNQAALNLAANLAANNQAAINLAANNQAAINLAANNQAANINLHGDNLQSYNNAGVAIASNALQVNQAGRAAIASRNNAAADNIAGWVNIAGNSAAFPARQASLDAPKPKVSRKHIFVYNQADAARPNLNRQADVPAFVTAGAAGNFKFNANPGLNNNAANSPFNWFSGVFNRQTDFADTPNAEAPAQSFPKGIAAPWNPNAFYGNAAGAAGHNNINGLLINSVAPDDFEPGNPFASVSANVPNSPNQYNAPAQPASGNAAYYNLYPYNLNGVSGFLSGHLPIRPYSNNFYGPDVAPIAGNWINRALGLADSNGNPDGILNGVSANAPVNQVAQGAAAAQIQYNVNNNAANNAAFNAANNAAAALNAAANNAQFAQSSAVINVGNQK